VTREEGVKPVRKFLGQGEWRSIFRDFVQHLEWTAPKLFWAYLFARPLNNSGPLFKPIQFFSRANFTIRDFTMHFGSLNYRLIRMQT